MEIEMEISMSKINFKLFNRKSFQLSLNSYLFDVSSSITFGECHSQIILYTRSKTFNFRRLQGSNTFSPFNELSIELDTKLSTCLHRFRVNEIRKQAPIYRY